VTPIDTGYAIAKTTVVITYDKSNIYVGAVCYDPYREKDLWNPCEGILSLAKTIISGYTSIHIIT
jgi:hypothetical protein